MCQHIARDDEQWLPIIVILYVIGAIVGQREKVPELVAEFAIRVQLQPYVFKLKV
jgi:hypothetical protein